MKTWKYFGILTGLVFFITGCSSDGLSFYHVDGKITFNGQPVTFAEIHIDPTGEGNSGRTVVCRAIDGVFKTPIGVAAGPAEWTVSVVDTSRLKIKDYGQLTDSDDSALLSAPKQIFTLQIPIEKEHYEVTLP